MGKKAVILAGGKGSRLGPYTTVLPKPLMPSATARSSTSSSASSRRHGFERITLAAGYLAQLIEAVFGEAEHGIPIDYYGRASRSARSARWRTIDGLDDDILVMNGDVLTDIDYGALLDVHQRGRQPAHDRHHGGSCRTDYGVIHVDGRVGDTRRVTGYEREAGDPVHGEHGRLLLRARARSSTSSRTSDLDFPDLVLRLLAAGEQVGHCLYDGYWLDIGRHDDYEKAIAEYEELKDTLWPEQDPEPRVGPVDLG